ncbi:hypothetical protein BJI67_10120 [Acidihalobacter aeolianus]|uniref:Dihydrofolate synthase/folylpolyglutamate synthase n=1 Tax=Acidihalobacter aeolianus TaxID=2792603 RepID=A0A1D8K8V5_9GAMM|nr:bifunctional tetrahydrofolate synthase/dihydrofolate synthase [Acidihalobacter aeolianus]AOV17365.1 hypothetical protein BJI67_10120 [Acidihalobacter aeolianus]
MRFDTLDDWLRWQETLAPKAIELGLERVHEVAARLDLLQPSCPVITVGGTNGKGSTVSMLTSMLHAGGYRVGTYLSPHLLKYNERVNVAGQPVEDALLCDAFADIDAARGEHRLTYFEFGTLAALWCFARLRVDAMVLEVGLGGRLDAVNIVDADVAVITTVDIDHAEWLGDTRELIAIEKAGIQRPGRPILCGDRNPPGTLLQASAEAGSRLLCIGHDFDAQSHADGMTWRFGKMEARLPNPGLRGTFQIDNAACACTALACLQDQLPVTAHAMASGLASVRLAARFEPMQGAACPIYLDVAHNPQAARALAGLLATNPVTGRTLAVFSALSDKDVSGIAAAMDQVIDEWFVGGLDGARGLDAVSLIARMRPTQGVVHTCDTVAEAYTQASRMSRPNDRIVVFGSFLTVAAVRQACV